MTDTEPDKVPSFATAKIEVWLAGVLMIVAFAVGFVLHGVTNEPAAPATQPITGVPAGGVIPAAPLTDSQLQGGVLPPNHPEVAPGQTGTDVPTASPSKAGGTKDKGNDNNNNP